GCGSGRALVRRVARARHGAARRVRARGDPRFGAHAPRRGVQPQGGGALRQHLAGARVRAERRRSRGDLPRPALPALHRARPGAESGAESGVESGVESPTPAVTTDPATGAIVAFRGAGVALAGGRVRPAAAACDWVEAHADAFGLRAGVDAVQVERDEPLAAG